MGLFKGQPVELVEEVLTESIGKEHIDRETRTIKNVRMLGRISKNGREYSDKALQQAAKLYESVEINLDHPAKGQEANSRSIRESWAKPFNLRVVNGDGVYADLRYLESHSETPAILERIENNFGIGLSHNAAGRLVNKGGKRIVESVDRVRTVDLVSRPATNENLFESEEDSMTKTVKQVLEAHKAEYPRLASLLEDVTADPMVAEAPVDVSAEADPATEVKSALEKAAIAVVKKLFSGDLELSAALAEIRKIKGMTDKAAPADESPSEPSESNEPTMESVAELVRKEIKSALSPLTEQLAERNKSDGLSSFMERKGITKQIIGQQRYELLEQAGSDEARGKLVESWPQYCQGGAPPATSPAVDLSESHEEQHVPLKQMARR